MTRSSTLKRSIDATEQQGSVKRLKSQKPERRQKSKPLNEYSRREITWKEQRTLGPEFLDVGEHNWPVLKILGERVQGRTKEYKIAWRPHPKSGEEFEPEWRAHSDVAHDLIAIWEQEKQQDGFKTPRQKEKTAARLAHNRRLLPNSSGTPAEIDQQSDAAHTPPSLLSGSSASGLDISESQHHNIESPRVIIPPLPIDKHEYETIDSTQPSPLATRFFDPSSPSSPEVHFNLSSSEQTIDPIVSASSPLPVPHPATIAVNGTQTTTKVSESSPHNSSVKSKGPSKLSKSVLSADEDIQPTISSLSPSQALQFFTQVSFTQTPGYKQTSPLRYPVLDQPVHLSSPFRDTITIRDSSSPTPIPQVRTSSPVRPRTISLERLHTESTPIPEVERLDSTTASRESSVLSTIPDQVTEVPSSIVEPFEKVIIDPSTVKMAASGIELAPLESTGSPLFIAPTSTTFDLPHDSNALALTIHESIEEEPQSSTDNSQLLNSKANSSQESLNNEREVETVDGIMIPVRPLLSPNEFVIPLPAEGKVKSQYDEIIKLQRKAIIRFISRTGSPGTSDISSKKTIERNAMQELLQQLNNTVTHTDLGLPMHTQYSLDPSANAVYAEYAGTKFEMLGYLIDSLKSKDCSVAVFAQPGPLQDLLEEYLIMKQVPLRRHDRIDVDSSEETTQGLSIDLFTSTSQSSKIISLDHKPLFIIAFDITFTISDQVRSIQEKYGDNLPILHFLVTNSSEHVEKCVPEALTSNIRLKVVVRTTYLASRNLGGDITYVPEESDQPIDGRGMDMLEFQRAVRKSPARRLLLIADIVAARAVSGDLAANWPLGSMPELKLNELETPPKISRAGSRTPQPRITRQSTPVSRAGTPIGKRRFLDVDGEHGPKRQRLTPVRDLGPEASLPSSISDDLSEARKRVSILASELASAKSALLVAEQNETIAKAKAQEWEDSHAGLMRRFEKDRLKLRDAQRESKKLNSIITNYQERDEGHRNEKALLRQQLSDAKDDLSEARKDLLSAGGDISKLEEARQETRDITGKLQSQEKAIKSLKEDFEFTRAQYQDISKLATDRTTEVKTLEDQVEKLKIAADDNKRSLKAMNYQTSLTMAMNKAEQFRLEVKNRESFIKKLSDENAALKSRRGVQTRGSSIQPASSPGPRSRQASPAATHLMPPSGSRASVLRHSER